MSNSALASYTKLSPNNSGKRTHAIDRITPHCVVGQLSVETLGNLFAKSSYQASCNYAIGSDGRVALIVDEGKRSWCSSSNANDQRAVTIECASDKTSPYAFNTTVYNKLIDLCVDICKRNGKNKLIWISDKAKALAYEPKSGEMLLTVHRWFASKSCPGDWMMARMGDLASKVTARLAGTAATTSTSTSTDATPHYYRVRTTWDNASSQKGAYSILDNAKAEADKWGGTYGVFDWNGKEVYRPKTTASTSTTKSYTQEFIEKIGPLAKKENEKCGLLASITLAQAILESGWGRSELATNAKNLFGMKKSLSGNTWSGSTWDGDRVYSVDTKEVYSGKSVTVNAQFRVYDNWEQSVADHSAYLVGAKNGSKLRYDGLIGCTDYRKAAQIIKDGEYATGTDYVDKICRIIEQYKLTEYDAVYTAATGTKSAAVAGQTVAKTTVSTEKPKEIRIFYPGYTRTSSPDDRQGAGCVWHDQNGNTIVIDAYMKNSAAAKRLVKYLVDNKLTKVSFLATHAHGDHIGGGFRLLEDSRITVTDIYCYDPASLKLAGDGSTPGKNVQGDKEYLKKFFNQGKDAGAKIHYVKTGDVIKCGEIELIVYRDQPSSWSKEYDYPEGWAYVNDGSICLYSKQAYYITAGDACAAEFIDEYNLTVKGGEVGHHGNNGTRSKAVIFVKHGCVFAIQCNNESGSPGSCEFTRYGSGRMREQGVTVWQLNADIFGVIKAGKATFTQGGNSISWTVPFGAQLYRVRTTWADSKTQKGAYNVLANAKAEADKWNGVYGVFDWNGKEVYRPKAKQDTKPAEQEKADTTPVEEKTDVKPAAAPKDGLFRVRKDWNDVKSQIGAYKNPKNGIIKAKEGGDAYELYDDNGVPVYPSSYRSGYFRIRKSWSDSKSQISAHKYLEIAIQVCDKHKSAGYSVYDNSGRKIYPV